MSKQKQKQKPEAKKIKEMALLLMCQVPMGMLILPYALIKTEGSMKDIFDALMKRYDGTLWQGKKDKTFLSSKLVLFTLLEVPIIEL